MAKKSPVRKVIKKVSGQRLAIGNETIARVRELAWGGQHIPAIDLATQALSAPKLKPAEQIHLLDLRAESYMAQGKLDLAVKDAKAMGKLAKTAAHKAQALNRLALVRMRTGDLKAAVKSATTAVNTKHTSQSIRATSLFRLSEAQFRTQQNEKAATNAKKAIDLFLADEDISGAGRAYWALANGYDQMRRMDECSRAAQAALELCTQVGDQYGIGNALNAVGLNEVDLAEAIRVRQRAVEAFERAGYIDRRQTALNNLVLAYQELGLYSHTHRLQSEGVILHRKMGTRVGLVYTLGNLIGVEIALGDLSSAQAYMEEFGRLVPELGDPSMDVTVEGTKGDLKFAEGDLKSAIRKTKSAVKMSRQHAPSRELVLLSELGKMYLADHDTVNALKSTTKATNLHDEQSFAKPDGYTSQDVWWWHSQALLASKKQKESDAALEKAYDFLLETIVNVRDEGLRRNLLNKVSTNRKLIQFWVKDAVKRKLPKERLFAHLNIESNLREPFKRLADTGLRLNALKSLSEIQTFLVEEATELSGGKKMANWKWRIHCSRAERTLAKSSLRFINTSPTPASLGPCN